jgi:hypothetical protein
MVKIIISVLRLRKRLVSVLLGRSIRQFKKRCIVAGRLRERFAHTYLSFRVR